MKLHLEIGPSKYELNEVKIRKGLLNYCEYTLGVLCIMQWNIPCRL